MRKHPTIDETYVYVNRIGCTLNYDDWEYENIIDAVERQKPMPVIKVRPRGWEMISRCGNCKEILYNNPLPWRTKYCGNCGQKILWEEENEKN